MDFQPMSPDEMQRAMQFLLSQQAQAAADMAAHTVKFDAAMEKLTAKTDRLVDALMGLTGIVGNIASQQERTDQQLRDTDRRLNELGEYIRTVESNLNAMIVTFERHLRDDHGRRPS